MDLASAKYFTYNLNSLLALTFSENFRSIRLTEEAPDEFCGTGGAGHGVQLYRKIRPSVQGLISNIVYTFFSWPCLKGKVNSTPRSVCLCVCVSIPMFEMSRHDGISLYIYFMIILTLLLCFFLTQLYHPLLNSTILYHNLLSSTLLFFTLLHSTNANFWTTGWIFKL